MFCIRMLGAVALAGVAPAQWTDVIDGSMTFHVNGPWILQGCTLVPETDDPLGVVALDGSRVNTYAHADGDTVDADGEARDTTSGGKRYEQTAQAEGLHICTWTYMPTPQDPDGEVEIVQDADIFGSVTLTNLHTAGAVLGFCEASSNITAPALALLDDSASETVAGMLGDLSGAFCGEAFTANPHFGNGTFNDSDSQQTAAVQCVNRLVVQHRSCGFVRVAAARVPASPGIARVLAAMTGSCNTEAWLYVCPDEGSRR